MGKTSFLKVLQGEDPPKEHNPTNARERTKVMPSKVDVQNDNTWIPLNKEKQIAEIKKRLLLRSLKPKSDDSNEDTITDTKASNRDAIVNNEDTMGNNNEALASDEDALSSDKGIKINDGRHDASHQENGKMTDSSKYPAKHDHQNDTTFDLRVNEAKENDNPSEHQSALDNEIIDCSVSDEPLETWKILTIIDTAGQPEFINLLPAINKLAKVTFVVFNMKSKLDDDVDINRGDGNKHKNRLTEKEYYSNMHAIKCLLSIVNHSSECDDSDDNDNDYKETNDKFQICLVGTHYDQVIGEFELEEMEEKIKDTIDQLRIGNLCSMWRFGDSTICKIDAHRKYSKDDDGDIAKTTTSAIENIRGQIEEVMETSSKNISTDISLNWLLLELQIQKKCEESKMIYMEWKEVTNLVSKENLSMEEDEITSALQYLHNTGFLLYFPEGGQNLSNIIFPNPDYLFQCLTKLINIARNGKCCDNKHVQELLNRGKLYKSLLDKGIPFEEDKAERLFPEKGVEILLVLLEYLKILTIHPEQENSESTIYFMPCVLPSCDLNNDELNSVRDDEVEPLHIRFKFGLIPRGVFCFLIVALLKEENIFKTIVGKRVYNNLIEIQTNTTDLEIVKIIDRIDSFDITVRRNDGSKVEDSIYYQVWNDISCALMNVWKSFKLSDSSSLHSKPSISSTSLSESSLEYGFRCWCSDCTKLKTICLAILSSPVTKMIAKCEQSKIEMKLQDTDKYKLTIWFVFKVSNYVYSFISLTTVYYTYILLF